jgi:hypothetical protein
VIARGRRVNTAGPARASTIRVGDDDHEQDDTYLRDGAPALGPRNPCKPSMLAAFFSRL